jgi:hypothetical protein
VGSDENQGSTPCKATTPWALKLEQNDHWTVQRARYMSLETIAPVSDDPVVGLPTVKS